MIILKTHTARVRAVSDAVDSAGIVIGIMRENERIVQGQLTPKSHLAAFEALGVETKRPYKFLYDLSDYGSFPIGSIVTFDEEGDAQFVVVSPERRHSVNNVASHCSVWFDEVVVTPAEEP